MNLNQLYYFRTLAEFEHYTRASEKLNIAQPTLSHAISSMEKELGTQLFEKHGRNVVLTKYGKIYMFYVENAISQLELGKNQIERMVSIGGGHMEIAYISTLGTDFIPNLISGFLGKPENKNISFSCYEGNSKNLVQDLKKEKYDMIFCSKIEGEPDIEFIPIYKQGIVVIVPENHELSEKESTTMEEIYKYPLITYTKDSNMRKIIDRLFCKAQHIPNIICQMEDVNSIAGLVSANQGIAIIADNLSVENYNVKKLKFDTIYSERTIYIAYMINRYLPQVVSSFRDYIVSYMDDKKKEEI